MKQLSSCITATSQRRFSTVILPQETYDALLSDWPIARLSTVSQEAQPHSVPIVFCGYRGLIYSPIDGKRKKHTRLQRFANLATNPKAALLLDEYTSDWEQLWWVRIDGKADLFEPGEKDADTIAAQLLDKYPQYRNPSLMFNPSVYLRLRPEQITAWTQSNSMATINAAVARHPASPPTSDQI